jgi:hypothetical protein
MDTIVSVSRWMASRFCSGVRTPSINFTVINGMVFFCQLNELPVGCFRPGRNSSARAK